MNSIFSRLRGSAVFSIALTNSFTILISVVTGIISARMLGAERRGYLAVAQSFGGIVGTIGGLCLGESMVYFVSRGHNPWLLLVKCVRIATLFTLPTISVGLIIAWTTYSSTPELLHSVWAYSFVALPFVVLGFPITFLRAKQEFRLWNRVRTAPYLSWLAILMVFGFSRRSSLVALIAAYIGLQLMCAIPLWKWLKSNYWSRADESTAVSTGQLIRFGAPLLMAVLPQALNIRLDQLALGGLGFGRQLGVYAVAVSWSTFALPVIASIGAVLFPRVASATSSSQRVLATVAVRRTILSSILVVSLSVLSAPFAIGALFGSDYRSSILLNLLLGGAAAALAVAGSGEEALRGLGRSRDVLAAEVAGLMGTVVALFITVQSLGVVGAAWASLFGYSITLVVVVNALSRELCCPISELLIVRRTDFGRSTK